MSIVNRVLAPVVIGGVLLGGCSMNNVVEKEKENQPTATEDSSKSGKGQIDNADIETVNDLKLNEGQSELLEEAESQTADAAVDYNKTNLSVQTELSNDVPVVKETYSDEIEAINYFSYQLFHYHSGLINGEEFYNSMKNHFSAEFIDLMPEKDTDRILMFNTLQETFSEQLDAAIEKYATTELTYSKMKNEGYFFRKYTLENGVEIFYETAVKNVAGSWKIVNDEPSIGYAIGADGEYQETFIQNKE